MDWRERNNDWFDRLLPDTMEAVILCDDDDELPEGFLPTGEPGEYKVAFKWGVCPGCEGDGTCVNPSIDSHGISQEEFEEDPDFEADYHNGVYDIQCPWCHGRTTVPVPKDDAVADWVEEREANRWQEDYNDWHTRRAESGWY